MNLAWLICLTTQTKWPLMGLVKEVAEAFISSLCNMKPWYRQLKKKQKDLLSLQHLYKAGFFSARSHLSCLIGSLSIYQLRLTDCILSGITEQFGHTLGLLIRCRQF